MYIIEEDDINKVTAKKRTNLLRNNGNKNTLVQTKSIVRFIHLPYQKKCFIASMI